MDLHPVTLPGSPAASALGFGCAPLGGRVGVRQARRALDVAWDLGVRYFDTARSYGYGESERILGAFARGRRDRLLIGTKAGIRAPRPSLARRLAKGVARRAFDVAPTLRQRLRGALGRQHQKGLFTAEDVRLSVDESLRELGTDYLDVLFLHECPLELLGRDELFQLLDDLRRAGKVRAWGLSSEADVLLAALGGARPDVPALQYRSNLLDPAPAALAEAPGRLLVANQPFGGGGEAFAALRRGLARVAVAPDTPPALARALRRPDAAVDVALNAVRHGPGQPLTLCSMTTPAHVQANVRAVERSAFSTEDLAAIRRAFATQGAE